MTNQMSLEETMKLIKLKKENPREYKEFLDDLTDIQLDLIEMSKNINKKLQKVSFDS